MAAAITSEEIRAALEAVIDPELGASIVELGMLGEIDISATRIEVHLALTTAGCPLKHQLKTDITERVRTTGDQRPVTVVFGEMDQTQRSAVMSVARKVAQDRAPKTMISAGTRVLAIASGKGGVGKSSLTANLAAALADRGEHVGILDADIWGFSIPQLFGVAERLGGHDGKIDPNTVEIGEGRIEIVSMVFLVEDGSTALMWRGLMLAKAVEQFLTDVRWGDLDTLLIDLPPGTGDVQMALARLLPQTEVIVVTTPARIAQGVAARVADMARKSHLRVIGVVENMSTYLDASGTHHDIFGAGGGEQLAEQLGVAFLGEVPIEPQVASAEFGTLPTATTHPDSQYAMAIRNVIELFPVRPEMQSCTARMMEALLNIERQPEPATT